jgi:hypothetical protein
MHLVVEQFPLSIGDGFKSEHSLTPQGTDTTPEHAALCKLAAVVYEASSNIITHAAVVSSLSPRAAMAQEVRKISDSTHSAVRCSACCDCRQLLLISMGCVVSL